jgi:hypothetical protein
MQDDNVVMKSKLFSFIKLLRMLLSHSRVRDIIENRKFSSIYGKLKIF